MRLTLVSCIWDKVEAPPQGFYDEFESIIYDALQSENAVDFCHLASPLRRYFQVHKISFNHAEVRCEGRLIGYVKH